MTDPLLLSVDVGLTSVKVVIFDARGGMRGRASQPYPTRRPRPDLAEQDPDEWWRAMRSAAARLPDDMRRGVAGVGITGHMHALVCVGPSGELLGPALVLGDRRAAAEAAEMTSRLGREKIYSVTGAEMDASMPAAKARHLALNDGASWTTAARLLGCSDFLRYRFTGKIGTNPIDACATSLYDVTRRGWSDLLLDAAGIPAAMMPEILVPWQRAGALLAPAAEALGVPRGIPVAVGAGDDLAVLGFGLTEPGTAIEQIGTTGSVMAVAPVPMPDPQLSLEIYPHVLPDRWVAGGSHTSAGSALRWAAQLLGYSSVRESASALSDHNDLRAVFVPTLAGQRFPTHDPDARGAWLGISLNDSRETLMRSVFEGVGRALAGILDRINLVVGPQRSVRVARSEKEYRQWDAMRAQLYATPLEVSEACEPTALGLAVLTAVATGVHHDVSKAVAAMCRVNGTVAPVLPGADGPPGGHGTVS